MNKTSKLLSTLGSLYLLVVVVFGMSYVTQKFEDASFFELVMYALPVSLDRLFFCIGIIAIASPGFVMVYISVWLKNKTSKDKIV